MDLLCCSIELSDEGVRADNLFPVWISLGEREAMIILNFTCGTMVLLLFSLILLLY